MSTQANISLVALTRSDLPKLYQWINDKALVNRSATYKPISELQHENWYAATMVRNDTFIFGIRLNSIGENIGTCQLTNINWIHRNAELQIRIGEANFTNKGFGKEALMLLLTFGFRNLNLHRIYLNVFESNLPAIKAYQKVGFATEGCLTEAAYIDGQYQNIIIMSILKRNYEKITNNP